jgi:hypothetical protein
LVVFEIVLLTTTRFIGYSPIAYLVKRVILLGQEVGPLNHASFLIVRQVDRLLEGDKYLWHLEF